MPSSLAALAITFALTFTGSWLGSPQPDAETNTATAVEDSNGDGAYLVAAMALFGLAGLAGITRRDYLRAHRTRRRRDPVASAPPSTEALTSPIERNHNTDQKPQIVGSVREEPAE